MMLRVSHLGYRYARATQDALDDVSLAVERGSVLGLLGPNGAGKTTLISHLAGALALQRGEIVFEGEPLAAVRARMPTCIAVAPQEYAYYPMLTVRENLDCFAAASRLHGAHKRTRIDACLAFTQLERHVAKRGSELSGGLKRRLNLAIALLPEPQLMLFDEPTAGVDPQTRAFMLEAIQGLARSGAAVIYTSHYMEEVEAIADRIVILDHGRVLRDGALHELLGEGATALSLVADGLPTAALRELLGRFGTLAAALADELPEGQPLHLSLAPSSRLVQVFAALDAAGARLRHAEFGRYDLEQLFMTLTHRSLRD
jgi:ABC-2 type transport system ATP-binding protein